MITWQADLDLAEEWWKCVDNQITAEELAKIIAKKLHYIPQRLKDDQNM